MIEGEISDSQGKTRRLPDHTLFGPGQKQVNLFFGPSYPGLLLPNHTWSAEWPNPCFHPYPPTRLASQVQLTYYLPYTILLASSVSIQTKKAASLSKTSLERYHAETNIKNSQTIWRKTTSGSHPSFENFSAAVCSWQWTSFSLFTHTDPNTFTILTPTSISSQLNLKEYQNMI